MSAPPGTLPARFALWVCAAACAATAFWTANGVAPWDGDRTNVWHQHEYLAEGFLRGHTYLSVDPAPELLRLKDPLDPRQNAPFRLWDASLYHGKYYLYYGPAPALLLMAPWEAVTGRVLPQRLAVAACAAAGLAALALLLWEVRRRHFPGLSSASLAWVLLVAFHASWLPVTLRRPGMWELPIVSATACLWWALYFLWKFHDSGGRMRWAAALGTALAVLMGCRITYLFSAAVVAVLALVHPGGGRISVWPLRRPALVTAFLAFAGGVALLAYNYERFGHLLEFGQSFQLWGMEERSVSHFSPGYVPFNVRTYLFSLPTFGPYFPFLHPYWPDKFPQGYVGLEEIYGIAFVMPVHLAGFAAMTWARRSLPPASRGAAGILLAASALCSLAAAPALMCWESACSRYTTELIGGWTVATAVGLMALLDPEGVARTGRMGRFLAVAAGSWTVACVWLASAEFRGFMKQTEPRVYTALAHALDYPSLALARERGIHFGPVDLTLRVAPSAAGVDPVLMAAGRPQRVNQLLLGPVEAGAARLILADNEHIVLESPPIPAPGDRVRVRLAAPWLYPPPESPYWDDVKDPAARRDLQTLFSLRWASGEAHLRSGLSADATDLEPVVRGPSLSAPGGPCVESIGSASP